MLITKTSILSGKQHTLDVPCTEEQFRAFENGVHVQRAMPNVPPPLREFVLSGITPEEWNSEFGTIEN